MGSAGQPDQRVAIVTGAARGIGAAIAVRLAEDGHDIAVLDLDLATCTATVESIEATGRRAMAVQCDVSNEAAVTDSFSEIADALGSPAILVNNAGILRDRSFARMTLDDWELVLNVNLRSVFLTCRAAQTYMRAAHWGRIVNLSSIAALGTFGEANYSAAKAGVQGITRTLAIELGRHNITANVVAPGFIETEMTRDVARRMNVSFEAMSKEMMRDIHVGRIGRPNDVANAVAFFVDERSSFVTGQVMYVAGGPRG